MRNIIRFISKFKKNGDSLIEILNFKNEPPLDFLKETFNGTDLMYEEYLITKEISEIIEPYLDKKLDTDNYDYFLSSEYI